MTDFTKDALRRQRAVDGWRGQVMVPRWYFYGTLALLVYLAISLAW